jgi:predicted metal-dependent hydrolase
LARLRPDLPLPAKAFVPGGDVPHPRRAGTLLEPADDDALPYGVDLFRAGFFWEAHEVWEALWVRLKREGPDADLVKALIKIAAAGVKQRQRQPAGVRSHLEGALRALPDDDVRLVAALRLIDPAATRERATALLSALEDASLDESRLRAAIVTATPG